ncbi:MAG: DUF1565 domain-containing protein [Clostridiales bacterium]|nr:DUF1565 domain-containing protein [Clostridiales bacterium]
MIFHVSINGSDRGDGSRNAPFRTINHAARMVKPGDTIQVHEGVYREWVDPVCSGLNDQMRITFEAAPGEHPVIKGSEIIKKWERVNDRVHKAVIPNLLFGDFNPYDRKIEGDWKVLPKEYDVHLGDVYLNGESMYEAVSLEALHEAPARLEGHCPDHAAELVPHPLPDPEATRRQWRAVVDEENTTIYCNFQGADPNNETVEINVRPCCFYPKRTGIDYVTVRGFEMAHAACPWAPPTADQMGLLGPHWSKGWLTEKNHLHDAKCCGISLGKDAATGDNNYTHYRRKPAYFYQMEAVFKGIRLGWDKEHVGSHVVKDNLIHDCGQAGIVGHMGCAFSRIEHNEIYRIAAKQEFWGHEIAGIKFHAAIDTVIASNNIHDCREAIWLDWQAQGTRITGNVTYNNARDLQVEVSNGPCLVDHNVFLSPLSYDDFAQGMAMVHNLFAGSMNIRVEGLGRNIPYHLPHSTQVAGYAEILGGDTRLINNVMMGKYDACENVCAPFSMLYDRFTTPEEFIARNDASPSASGIVECRTIPQPVWIEGNAYAGNAVPFRAEKNTIEAEGFDAVLEERGDSLELVLQVPRAVAEAELEEVTTERLGYVRFPEEGFEHPNGEAIDFSMDLLGVSTEGKVIPGPFTQLKAGKQRITVWKRK